MNLLETFLIGYPIHFVHMMNNTGKAITVFGLMVLLGWLGPYFFGTTIVPVAMLYWSVLIVIGLVAIHFWIPNAWNNKTVQVWAALVILFMIENWLVSLKVLPGSIMMLSYNHLWLLVGAIGFYLTTKTWKIQKSVPIYLGAAVLNAILFVLYFTAMDLKIAYPLSAELWGQRWLLMALVQGAPVLLDGLTNYHTPAKK